MTATFARCYQIVTETLLEILNNPFHNTVLYILVGADGQGQQT